MPTIDIEGKFRVRLGEPTVVKNHCKCPLYPWFPDGHITVQPHPLHPGKFRMVWAGGQSYLSEGFTAYPEDHSCLEMEKPAVSNMTEGQSWYNGTWLMAIFQQGETLVGFIHAEDAYKDVPNPDAVAYKSAGVCYSNDGGSTWSKPEQILRSPLPRPSPPDWGGPGDLCVVRKGEEYYLFYTSGDADGNCHPKLAKSSDPMGKPGTWWKYSEGSFSSPGLGGEEGTPESMKVWVAGANPSVTWNSHLELWIMVWHAWGQNVVLSSSPDLLQWHHGVPIVVEDRNTWYPTIIGDMGDLSCGRQARLYYSDFEKGEKPRQFVGRDIVFLRPGEEETYKPSKYSNPDYEPQCHPSHPDNPGFMYPSQQGGGHPWVLPVNPMGQCMQTNSQSAVQYSAQQPASMQPQQQQQYGQQQGFYNNQQQPYGQQQYAYGQNAYGQQQHPYGQQQYPYVQQQHPHGQQWPQKPPGGLGGAGAGILAACCAALCCCGLLDMASV